MPLGRPAPQAPGVAAAIAGMFDAIRSSRPDVVSQHAFDAPAFDQARGLAALHTLHLPPLVPAVVAAAASTPAAQLATVSASMLRAWRAAGVDVGRVLRNGVEDVDVPDGAPEHLALVAGRISPEKGIEDALTAARLAGLPARVAGAVYDPAYDVDLRGAERLGELTRLELRRVPFARKLGYRSGRPGLRGPRSAGFPDSRSRPGYRFPTSRAAIRRGIRRRSRSGR